MAELQAPVVLHLTFLCPMPLGNPVQTETYLPKQFKLVDAVQITLEEYPVMTRPKLAQSIDKTKASTFHGGMAVAIKKDTPIAIRFFATTKLTG